MMMSREMFATFVDNEYDFYGVDCNRFCIGSGGSRLILEAREDEADGYRSYFDTFVVSHDRVSVFHTQPLARVRLKMGGLSSRIPKRLHEDEEETLRRMRDEFTGWVLIDVDTEHVWLTVGTDFGDDYYPCFTFRYEPDPRKTIQP